MPQLGVLTKPLLAREGSLHASLSSQPELVGRDDPLLMLGTNWKCRCGTNARVLLHLCEYLECRWSVLGDLQCVLGAREGSLSAVIALGAGDALANSRAQGVGEAVPVFCTHQWMYLASIPGAGLGF